MKKLTCTTKAACLRRAVWAVRPLIVILISAAVVAMIGCGTAKVGKKKENFFTSGSREADQRASQRMAKEGQLTGTGEGAGEKGAKKAEKVEPNKDGTSAGATNKPAQVEGKMPLFDRLGAEPGISNIVADFLPRAMHDPRVNWQRKDVKRTSVLRRGESVIWKPTAENVANLTKHFIQFLALATGGPAQYDGKEMKAAHAGMRISNPEFDAAIGDLKASLDKLKIPNQEQKELLSIIESTRPLIVTER